MVTFNLYFFEVISFSSCLFCVNFSTFVLVSRISHNIKITFYIIKHMLGALGWFQLSKKILPLSLEIKEKFCVNH